MRVVLLLWAAAVIGLAAPALAADPVVYTLRFPDRAQHYVDVEALIPSDGQAQVELMLPVWTPGSYLVRDHARHLEALTVDGEPTVERTAKNRWRVATGGKKAVAVRYRLYGRLLTVRTNFVDAGFALINGAATFLTPLEQRRQYVVRVLRPADWSRTITGLSAGGPHRYVAGNYDQLVDSPILVGNPEVTTFKVGGKPHVLADQGGSGLWDGEKAAADLAKIVDVQRRFWGGLPYEKYRFINILQEVGGGLEHLNSTVIMNSRFAQRDRKAYINWLRLAAHEFFHTWNVKRLRPVELGPFDYERENHTRSLWVAEGITSYYDVLTVRRANISTTAELLEGLSKKVKRVQDTPGRAVRSLEQASYDAWIKFYKADENTPNVAPSYYVKGSVVAFLLDMEIRRRTADKRSLDDVMRAASAQFSGKKGFETEQFYALASKVAGVDLSDFFARYAAGTAELDYGPALAWLGLRFKPVKQSKTPDAAWLGARTAVKHGLLIVKQVRRGTPAYTIGLNAGDEILAIDDQRIPPSEFETRIGRYRAGEKATVLIARRGALLRLPITFSAKPAHSWTIEVDPKAKADAKARRARWITQP